MQAEMAPDHQALPLKISLLHSFEDLVNHKTALDNLAQDAIEPNPFFEPWCLFPALKYLDESAGAVFLMAHDETRLVGFLPVTINKGYSRLPVSYLQTFMHRHCFLGTPLIRNGYAERFIEQLPPALAAAGLPAAFLQLRHIVGNSTFEKALTASVPPDHAYQAYNWERAALSSSYSYEQYIHTNMRSKKRKEMRRLHNRLSEEGVVSCRTLTDPTESDQWCRAFMDMEHEGWRGHGGSSLIGEKTAADYLQETVREGLAADRVLFLRLDLDRTPIAMLINFRNSRRAWSFKIAFNAAYSRFSPGVMIEQELMRLTLDRKMFDRIDSCASRNHPMIDRLWAERESLCYWNIALPGTRNQLAFHLCRNIEGLSATARRVLGTSGVSA